MSDTTTEKIPTKEEIVAFLTEQIEVKELQCKLQELTTRIANARAEELRALSFMGQMTNPRSEGTPYEGGITHTITQEDLDNNPDLKDQGVEVGDEIIIEEQPEKSPTKKDRALKKK